MHAYVLNFEVVVVVISVFDTFNVNRNLYFLSRFGKKVIVWIMLNSTLLSE